MKNKISIIVPVYNVEQYLNRGLTCLINQTLKDIEIICINDCSTDNSLKILEDFSKKDSRIKIIDLKENKGAAYARNEGLKIASCEYLGFIDPDDSIDLDFYEKLYQKATLTNADITKANCKYYQTDGKCKITNLNKDIRKNKFAFKHEWWCGLYKSELIFSNKIDFPVECFKGQDGVFLIKALLKSNKVETVDDVFYSYFRREDSLDANKIPLKSIKSAMLTKTLILNCLNKSTLYKTNEDDYIYAYNIRLLSIFYNINQNDEPQAKEICIKSLVENFLKCKNVKKLKKVFPHKWIIEKIENNKTDELIKDFIKYNNYLLLKKEPIKKDKIIVSMTSYPKRIKTISKTIESIVNQTLKPDKILLWLSNKEFNSELDLPKELLNFKKQGLEICFYNQETDIKPYNKLINTLYKYPDNLIITADDDIIYDKNCIKALYKEYLKNPDCIITNRAHYVTFKNQTKIARYSNWFSNIKLKNPSYNLFLTGVGMVLYFPNCFYKDILKEELFLNLAPNTDDIWFWAMAVLNNTKIKTTELKINLKYSENSQDFGLYIDNCINQNNDKNLKKILNYYPEIIKKLSSKIVMFYPNFWAKIFSKKKIENRILLTIFGIKFKYERKMKRRISELEEETSYLQEKIIKFEERFKNFQNWQNNFMLDIPQNFPIRLTNSEKEILIHYLKNSKNYVEFGSGGSTFLALINSDTKIYSIESDFDWINYLKSYKIIQNAIAKGRLDFKYIDIGKTKNWGYPVSTENSSDFPDYSSQIFDELDSEKIDLVFIDGRFRVACAIKSILHCKTNTFVLIHDYEHRKQYHIIEKYVDFVEKSDNLYIFKIRENNKDEELNEIYEKYKYIVD